MAKRRMPEIMRQAGRIDQVGITAERGTELAPYLGAFQRVGEPGPRKVTRTHLDDLRLCGETPQRCAVQYPGAVPLERTAPGTAGTLGRLGGPPGRRMAVIADGHRRHAAAGPPRRRRPVRSR